MSSLMKEQMRNTALVKKLIVNNLTYHFENPRFASINFTGFKDPVRIYNKIINGDISIKKLKMIKKNSNQI